jgi:hypothetical protein
MCISVFKNLRTLYMTGNLLTEIVDDNDDDGDDP